MKMSTRSFQYRNLKVWSSVIDKRDIIIYSLTFLSYLHRISLEIFTTSVFENLISNPRPSNSTTTIEYSIRTLLGCLRF